MQSNNTGHFTVPMEEIHESMGDETVTIASFKTVLKRVQRFMIRSTFAASDLRDCLPSRGLVGHQRSSYFVKQPRLSQFNAVNPVKRIYTKSM
jgi:hypothetical protein